MTRPLPRLCFLTGTLNVMAGAERMTATIANALAGQGYTVSILSLWDHASRFSLHPNVSHETLFAQRPSFKSAYAATVAGIRRHVRTRRIDVLVQVDTMLALFALPATLGLGVRHIAWEHCHFDEDLGKPARRLARRLAAHHCEAIVVLTERDRRRWVEALRPRSAVVCIPNPLPFAMPVQAAPRTNKLVLAVGRLVASKGFDVLIRAWSQVVPKAPGWQIVIVGEGEERATLEGLRNQLGLQDSVTLPGVYADVTVAYQQASIFCLSSRYEGFGLVLIEAMAFGLPIISTDCETGPRELLEDGREAVVVGVDDAQALSKGILRLIQNRGEADLLSQAARARAYQYSQQQIMNQWQVVLLQEL